MGEKRLIEVVMQGQNIKRNEHPFMIQCEVSFYLEDKGVFCYLGKYMKKDRFIKIQIMVPEHKFDYQMIMNAGVHAMGERLISFAYH